MTTFTVHTDNKEQLIALKAFMKALKIKFEIGTEVIKEHEEYLIPQWQQDLVLNRVKKSTKANYTSIETLDNEIRLQK